MNNIFLWIFLKLKLFLRFIESYKNPKLWKTVSSGLADALKGSLIKTFRIDAPDGCISLSIKVAQVL